MATNKHKDAAALFELIDKSTLKVPKGAGALKIPSWWSSKTNPATATLSPSPVAKTPAVRPVMLTAPAAPETPAPSYAPTPLFAHGDIPTGQEAPAKSIVPTAPAIAPPATPLTSVPATPTTSATPQPNSEFRIQNSELPAPAPVAPKITPVATAPAAPTFRPPAKPAAAPIRPIAAAATPKPIGVFAPATMDPNAASRRSNMANQKQALLRTPVWAVIGLATIAALILGLGIYLLPHKSSTDLPPLLQDSRGPILGAHTVHDDTPGTRIAESAPAPTHPDTPIAKTPDPAPTPAPEAGQVMDEKDVQRSANLRYLIIASHPYSQPDIAKRNAKFLADHGVSVALAPQKPSAKTGLPTTILLISVEGFPGMTDAAEAFRKKVVEIGKLHPDFKRNHNNSVWNDAYFSTVKR